MCACTYGGLGSNFVSGIFACHEIVGFWHSIEPGRRALTPRDDTGYAVGQIQKPICDQFSYQKMPICDQFSYQSFRVCPFFVKIQPPPRYLCINPKVTDDLNLCQLLGQFCRSADHADENTSWTREALRNTHTQP